MAQTKKKEDTTENITVIMANQNFYVRNVIGKVVDFLETLFIAIAVLLLVIIVDCFVVAIALNSNGNAMLILTIMVIISVPIICVLVATPIRCFKTHSQEIEELHQQCTELEEARLKDYLEKEQ